jgi:hypothetical protein
MPSADVGGTPPGPPPTRLALAPRPPRLAWLRSQGLGLLCGLATVVLLAVGSVVLVSTRDGASASVGLDDLRGFFEPPRLEHLWLYLLFPVAGLYAVNTVLATWDTVLRKWRAGLRAPGAYAPSLIHVGFLLALVAHGVGGFLGAERGAVLVGPDWQSLPGFGEARLRSLDVDALPGGMPRAAWAHLEVRDGSGGVHAETVGYNVPLSARGGAALALLSDFGQAWIARLVSRGESCALAEGQSCLLGGASIRLVRLVGGPRGPAAVIAARGPSGHDETRVLSAGGELPLAGGALLELGAVAPEQVVALRVRETPGHPWALAAGVVMALGSALLWRKLLRRRSGRSGAPGAPARPPPIV